MNIYLEIFGYCGTALVLLSMMMTSVVKLRWFNSVGSLVSMIYAYLNNTWPVVLLNFGLLLINVFQLVRLYRVKVSFDCARTEATDGVLQYFLKYYGKDIAYYFPGFDPKTAGDTVYVIYRNADPVGVLMGIEQGDSIRIMLDYTTPQYRDCSVAGYLFGYLKTQGIRTLQTDRDAKGHVGYLKKMGFVKTDGLWQKNL